MNIIYGDVLSKSNIDYDITTANLNTGVFLLRFVSTGVCDDQKRKRSRFQHILELKSPQSVKEQEKKRTWILQDSDLNHTLNQPPMLFSA